MFFKRSTPSTLHEDADLPKTLNDTVSEATEIVDFVVLILSFNPEDLVT